MIMDISKGAGVSEEAARQKITPGERFDGAL